MEAPKVTVNVAVLDNDALLPALRNGDFDIAVTHTRQSSHADLTLEPNRKDEFVAYCASSHRRAKRRRVTLEDLAQERWAAANSAAGAFGPLLVLRQAFEKRGLPAPRITLISDSVTFRLCAVARSDLIGIAVRGNVLAAPSQLDLKILPVEGLEWVRPVAIAYRKDAYLSPAARRFVEILKVTDRGNKRAPTR